MITNNYAPWLFLLTGFFALRVLAQFVTFYVPVPFLPPFEAWHSGTMPYWLLVSFQLGIFHLMLHTSVKAYRNRLVSQPKVAKYLWVAGIVYMSLMLVRLALGQTLFEEHRWFSNTLSTSFHFVLATFVLTTATVLKNNNSNRGVLYV